MTRSLEQLSVEHITVRDGRRPVDAVEVVKLAQSIEQIGLRTPITVNAVDGGAGPKWRIHLLCRR